MGRPRSNVKGLSATEKIENAFWKILELEGFENITILRITQETGLNRNTIYYHYQNVEDVAKRAIEHTLEKQYVKKFISTILAVQNDLAGSSKLVTDAKRIHLLAGSKSPFLQSYVKKKLIDTWLESFSIDLCKLSSVDRVSVDFIASGIISIIGSNTFIDRPELISAFPASLVGKAAIQTLQSLSKQI